MEVSAVGSSPQSSGSDLAQLVQQIEQVQIDMIKKMLQAQAESEVGAEKIGQAEQVEGSVDYYA